MPDVPVSDYERGVQDAGMAALRYIDPARRTVANTLYPRSDTPSSVTNGLNHARVTSGMCRD